MARSSSRISSGTLWAVLCVIAAIAALALWLAPLSPAWVEREYSSSRYLTWQQFLTPLSNMLPVALFDVIIVVVIVALLLGWRVRYRIARRNAGRWDRAGSWRRQVPLALLDLAGVAAMLYLWFALAW